MVRTNKNISRKRKNKISKNSKKSIKKCKTKKTQKKKIYRGGSAVNLEYYNEITKTKKIRISRFKISDKVICQIGEHGPKIFKINSISLTPNNKIVLNNMYAEKFCKKYNPDEVSNISTKSNKLTAPANKTLPIITVNLDNIQQYNNLMDEMDNFSIINPLTTDYEYLNKNIDKNKIKQMDKPKAIEIFKKTIKNAININGNLTINVSQNGLISLFMSSIINCEDLNEFINVLLYFVLIDKSQDLILTITNDFTKPIMLYSNQIIINSINNIKNNNKEMNILQFILLQCPLLSFFVPYNTTVNNINFDINKSITHGFHLYNFLKSYYKNIPEKYPILSETLYMKYTDDFNWIEYIKKIQNENSDTNCRLNRFNDDDGFYGSSSLVDFKTYKTTDSLYSHKYLDARHLITILCGTNTNPDYRKDIRDEINTLFSNKPLALNNIQILQFFTRFKFAGYEIFKIQTCLDNKLKEDKKNKQPPATLPATLPAKLPAAKLPEAKLPAKLPAANLQPLKQKINFFEAQESAGCGRHSLNNLLQNTFFIKGEDTDPPYTDPEAIEKGKNLSSEPGKQFNLRRFCKYLAGMPMLNTTPDAFCEVNENYDVNVLQKALEFCGFEVHEINIEHNNFINDKINDSNGAAIGYIINYGGGHWVALRYNKDAIDDKKYELINSTYQNKSTQNRIYYADKVKFRKENDSVGKFSKKSRFYNIFKVYNRNKQIIQIDIKKFKAIQSKDEKSQLDLKAIKDEIYRNFEINFPKASPEIKNFIMIIMDCAGVDINDKNLHYLLDLFKDNDIINIKLACITEIYDKYKNELICNQPNCLEKPIYENGSIKLCNKHKTNAMTLIQKDIGYGNILFMDIKQNYEECMTKKLTSGINTNSNKKPNNNKTKKNNFCYQ